MNPWEHPTSNIQHPTLNRQSMAQLETIGCSMLDVGCWMFSFGSWVQCAKFLGNSLPATKEWGEDRGEGQTKTFGTNAPPLRGPLFHPPCSRTVAAGGGEAVVAALSLHGPRLPPQ